MLKLNAMILHLFALVVIMHTIYGATVYKSYTSDVTKAYPANTALALPKALSTYAEATSVADANAYSAHVPCKKHHHHHRHQHRHHHQHKQLPKIVLSASTKPSAYSYYYPGQELATSATPSVLYYVAAPAASSHFVDANGAAVATAAASASATAAATGVAAADAGGYANYQPWHTAAYGASHTLRTLPTYTPTLLGNGNSILDFLNDLSLQQQFTLYK